VVEIAQKDGTPSVVPSSGEEGQGW
jgi:hypothetical protein